MKTVKQILRIALMLAIILPILVGLVALIGPAPATAGGVHSPKTYYRTVTVSNYTAVQGITFAFGTNGSYTGAVTRYYRMSGTNTIGRLPVSGIYTQTWTGVTNASNVIVISWTKKQGVISHVVEISSDGTTWTNWATRNAQATNFFDYGNTNTLWTNSIFTNVYQTVCPGPSVPWITNTIGTDVWHIAAGFKASAGSPPVPTYTWLAATNTGMYQTGTHHVGVSVTGTNRLSLDANGAHVNGDLGVTGSLDFTNGNIGTYVTWGSTNLLFRFDPVNHGVRDSNPANFAARFDLYQLSLNGQVVFDWNNGRAYDNSGNTIIDWKLTSPRLYHDWDFYGQFTARSNFAVKGDFSVEGDSDFDARPTVNTTTNIALTGDAFDWGLGTNVVEYWNATLFMTTDTYEVTAFGGPIFEVARTGTKFTMHTDDDTSTIAVCEWVWGTSPGEMITNFVMVAGTNGTITNGTWIFEATNTVKWKVLNFGSGCNWVEVGARTVHD